MGKKGKRKATGHDVKTPKNNQEVLRLCYEILDGKNEKHINRQKQIFILTLY